jgi:hypothetical protein
MNIYKNFLFLTLVLITNSAMATSSSIGSTMDWGDNSIKLYCYLQDSALDSEELYHKIHSEEFEYDGVKFRNLNLETHIEWNEESPSIINIKRPVATYAKSDLGDDIVFNLRWKTDDGVGFYTTFYAKPVDEFDLMECYSVNYPGYTMYQQPNTDLLRETLLSKIGYQNGQFDIGSFKEWYKSYYMGFSEEQGFYKDGLPLVFNGAYREVLEYLPFSDEFKMVHLTLNLDTPFEEYIQAIVEKIELFEEEKILQKPFNQTRTALKLLDGYLYDGDLICEDFDDKVYGINECSQLFITGADGGHHPLTLAGKFAWCAGHLSVKDGKIYSISNTSGHYRPSLYNFYTLVEFLNEKDLFSEGVLLSYYTGSMGAKKLIEGENVEDFFAKLDRNTLEATWREETSSKISDSEFFAFIMS